MSALVLRVPAAGRHERLSSSASRYDSSDEPLVPSTFWPLPESADTAGEECNLTQIDGKDLRRIHSSRRRSPSKLR